MTTMDNTTDITVNLLMPRSWDELSPRQLRHVLSLISRGRSTEEVKIWCLARWNRLRVVGRRSDGMWLLRMGKTVFHTSALAMAEILTGLGWMGRLPSRPVRPERLQGRRALPADLGGVPFSTFIIAENLYQGWLETRDDSLLALMFGLLYPGAAWLPPLSPRRAWHLTAVFYWWAGLKEMFATRWPDFFQPSGTGTEGNLLPAPHDPEKDMNAMIRALTKGDVTKEMRILEMDTWRALEELNAQAREYREFDKKYGGKR